MARYTPEQAREFYGSQKTGLIDRINAIRPVWQGLTALQPLYWNQSAEVIEEERAMFARLRAGLPSPFLQKLMRFEILEARRSPQEEDEYTRLKQDPDVQVGGALVRVINHAEQQRNDLREMYTRLGTDVQNHVQEGGLLPGVAQHPDAILEISPDIFSFTVSIDPARFNQVIPQGAEAIGLYDSRTSPYYSYTSGYNASAAKHEQGHALTSAPIYDQMRSVGFNLPPAGMRAVAQRLRREYYETPADERGAKKEELRQRILNTIMAVSPGELFAELFAAFPEISGTPQDTYAYEMRQRSELLRAMRPEMQGLRAAVIDPALKDLDDSILRRNVASQYARLQEASFHSDEVFAHIDDFAIAMMILPINKMYHLERLVDLWISEGNPSQ